jgi:energy-converting hydrogenase A subunit M
MAEPAGLAVGVFALLGLFNNAVDCFNYVQAGRDLGKSYITCQIKLSNAQLRFTRWGEAVGLPRDAEHESQLDHDTLARNFDEAKVRKAKVRISHIIQLFAEAEDVSQKYKPHGSVPDAGVHSEDDRKALELAEQVRNMSLRRKSKNSFLQKAAWALYRADAFKDLLSDVADLEELFPAVETTRQQLANREVDSLSTSTQLALLKEAAASEEVQDQLLAAALDRKLAQLAGGSTTIYNNTFGNDNKGFQSGHVSGGTFTFGK